jgi:hypothetical protein
MTSNQKEKVENILVEKIEKAKENASNTELILLVHTLAEISSVKPDKQG